MGQALFDQAPCRGRELLLSRGVLFFAPLPMLLLLLTLGVEKLFGSQQFAPPLFQLLLSGPQSFGGVGQFLGSFPQLQPGAARLVIERGHAGMKLSLSVIEL